MGKILRLRQCQIFADSGYKKTAAGTHGKFKDIADGGLYRFGRAGTL